MIRSDPCLPSSVFRLRLSDGTAVVVPASLDNMTTYVLLEQESWFEKEPAFLSRWLKPGMTAIDIGANVGVYSLAMARRVGPSGHVYAYEPAREPRAFLEKGVAANGLANLTVLSAALSDTQREGQLVQAWSSELHHLASGEEQGEAVAVTSLDDEMRDNRWPRPDFVKIDAEGEERRILFGGRELFARHSPLIMFEIKAGERETSELIAAFRASGYNIYRLLPCAPLLVPADTGAIDPYEFNLFAAKADRAAALEREGLLIEGGCEWSPDDAARQGALAILGAQMFGPAQASFLSLPIDPAYHDALAAYAAWRSETNPWPQRYGALLFSFRRLSEISEGRPGLARLSTLARAAWDLGERKASVAALNALVTMAKGNAKIAEPFWPANPRFDAIAPGEKSGQWFMIGSVEQREKASSHSSFFMQETANMEWLARQPFFSAEMERRLVLHRLRRGVQLEVPERLRAPAADHLNWEVWRSRLIPNTL